MQKICNLNKFFIPVLFSVFFAFFFIYADPKCIFADSKRIDELKEEINQKNSEVKDVEKEIEEYQKEINKTLEEKQTLKNEVWRLQTNADKLRAEIRLTEKKIDNSNFTIEKINLEIENKEEQITTSKNSLAEIIRKLNEEESNSLVEILLTHDNLSDFFANIDRMEYLQKDININLGELKILKNDLEERQNEEREEKEKHETLNEKLGDQKKIVDWNKRKTDNLLTDTKNKEENYRQILEEKIAKRDAFLSEMSELEAQLQIEIDPNSIPEVGTGILKWPLDDISLESCWNGGEKHNNCVTQFFGNTPFATKNPQVYGGQGHNGIDFRASVGEPIRSSLSGIVEETGNTDLIRGCYSYGKWVLIKHNNGLSTLYAHLSLIKVKKGQTINTRELIGYSGETGYATGPHLHFTVYASQGVKIMRLGEIKKITNCANARIPIADKKAYLNPLSYLSDQ